ncbi:lipase family protein [Mycolicibacterium hippocampi]|uniref:Triacylglycerol lipase n=1 Tax=Mycolicibacterium hippocampi TaxID=659824 RepID=A0A850PTT9_9MYCO|nr:lipase family protein [Mycolicibacterium hippocampi]NVN53741.1 Triacylglycerol lipase precursor [Mycolicibacterium hippocampi]
MRPRRPSREPEVRATLIRYAKSLWPLALVGLLLVSLATVTDSGPKLPSSPSADPIITSIPGIAGDVWASRGLVVHRETYGDVPLEDKDAVLGEAWRAVYTSVSGVDGGIREVSGAFFIPRGVAPAEGWPVVSLAHGTTGIGNNCGPSQQPDLMGYGPVVGSLLANRFAVALTDYEGLGPSGTHPYLEPRTAAFNTIDAVRALREISPSVSSRWVALGYSQGGQAVWAANELDSFYADDLELQGSVALAPAANVTGVADLAWSRSMSDEQRATYPLLVVGVSRFTPDLDKHAFLHGSEGNDLSWLSHCEINTNDTEKTPVTPYRWQEAIARTRQADEMKPATTQDADTLRNSLRKAALPQRPLEKPMLVITGRADSLVLSEWVQAAVTDSCAIGGRIEYLDIPDVDHRGILWKASDIVMGWMDDRFAGLPAPSNCSAQQP